MREDTRQVFAMFPDWVREIDFALPFSPQLLVTGNVGDVHQVPDDYPHLPPQSLLATPALVREVLVRNGYGLIVVFDLVDGLMPLTGTDAFRRIDLPDAPPVERLRQFLQRTIPTTVEPVSAERPRTAIIVDYASHLGRLDTEEVAALLRTATKLADRALARGDGTSWLFDPVIWLARNHEDLPAWFSGGPGVRSVVIPRPTLAARERFAPRVIDGLAGAAELAEGDRTAALRAFSRRSDGLTTRDLLGIQTLATDRGIPATRVGDAVRLFQSGLRDDPWRNENLGDTLVSAEAELQTLVYGQEAAIAKSLGILYRAFMGLNGSQVDGAASTRPRGVAFFAGPTGVGKTELAKRLAALIFGSETSLLRFDMSEYGEEGSVTRLIGAPPSYVGHESGGQLTNAVLAQPFSIVLFDEIEKAHPTILRQFLQILSDGRLTDSLGRTVSFTDTIVLFTSNEGVTGPDGELIVGPDRPEAELEASVRAGVERYLSEAPVRMPELLNRIGRDNIVVFQFVRSPDDERILDRNIRNVLETVRRVHGVTVVLEPAVRDALVERLSDERDMGGRGIENLVVRALVDPLSRALFASRALFTNRPPGERTLRATRIALVEGIWAIDLESA